MDLERVVASAKTDLDLDVKTILRDSLLTTQILTVKFDETSVKERALFNYNRGRILLGVLEEIYQNKYQVQHPDRDIYNEVTQPSWELDDDAPATQRITLQPARLAHLQICDMRPEDVAQKHQQRLDRNDHTTKAGLAFLCGSLQDHVSELGKESRVYVALDRTRSYLEQQESKQFSPLIAYLSSGSVKKLAPKSVVVSPENLHTFSQNPRYVGEKDMGLKKWRFKTGSFCQLVTTYNELTQERSQQEQFAELLEEVLAAHLPHHYIDGKYLGGNHRTGKMYPLNTLLILDSKRTRELPTLTTVAGQLALIEVTYPLIYNTALQVAVLPQQE